MKTKEQLNREIEDIEATLMVIDEELAQRQEDYAHITSPDYDWRDDLDDEEAYQQDLEWFQKEIRELTATKKRLTAEMERKETMVLLMDKKVFEGNDDEYTEA